MYNLVKLANRKIKFVRGVVKMIEKNGELKITTLAVIGIQKDGRYYTKLMDWVAENDSEIELSTDKVMDENCRLHGSSFRGLLEGSREITQSSHKPPIVLDKVLNMYYFPVESPIKKTCTWIAHSHVRAIRNYPNNQTNILFHNNRTLTLDISHPVVFRQLNKTAQYRCTLTDRIQKLRPIHKLNAQHYFQTELPHAEIIRNSPISSFDYEE